MSLDELLKNDSRQAAPAVREEHLCATVAAARARFIQAEAEMPLPFYAFLRGQLRLMHKRWWLAQALLLALVAWLLPGLEDFLLCRTLGLAGALFVVLLVPECARNRTHVCLEIEATTYYSLRHIYAARLLLFGLVDVVLLSGFCGLAAWSAKLPLLALLTQFLLPLVVTAALCFAVLSCRRGSGGAATSACLLAGGGWWLVLRDEQLYQLLTVPVWLVLFAASLVFLAYVIQRWINESTKQWEVHLHGTLYE